MSPEEATYRQEEDDARRVSDVCEFHLQRVRGALLRGM